MDVMVVVVVDVYVQPPSSCPAPLSGDQVGQCAGEDIPSVLLPQTFVKGLSEADRGGHADKPQSDMFHGFPSSKTPGLSPPEHYPLVF